MDREISKQDLDSIGRPRYIGAYPPFYLVDYCKKVLLDLEKMHDEDLKIRILCGVVDDLYKLGISKGAAAIKSTVIANLFR